MLCERFIFEGFFSARIALKIKRRTSYQDSRPFFPKDLLIFRHFFASVEMNSVDGRPIFQVVVLYSHKSD